MSLLDQVKQMQQQGLSDNQISQTLGEQGNNPKEINDALSQSKIKSAINQEIDTGMQQQGLQPSMLQTQMEQDSISPGQPPQEQTQQYPQEVMSGQDQQYGYEQYPQQGYDQYSQQGYGLDSINEITEQIINSKISSLKKKISEASEMKSEFETKIDLIDKRLKKIEDTIDRLESSILQRIGEYSKGIMDIKAETSMIRQSFSKAIPSLVAKTKTKRKRKKKK